MKLVVWGLPLHSHTHSYVHHAFARAAVSMGYETFWVEDAKDSNLYLTQDTIVICCGVSDKHLGYKEGVKYVLHNSDRHDLRVGKYIDLQVYTTDVYTRNVSKLNYDLTYWEDKTRTLFQPWATDLLPDEILKLGPKQFSDSNEISWVGTITSGQQGNYDEILKYADICAKNGLAFTHRQNISVEDNIAVVRNSRQCPTIQGRWQVEKGYIPCRIFKNISYGCWTETNSKTTAALLGLEQHEDMQGVFAASEEMHKTRNSDKIFDKMKLVAEKHTYVNRIQSIVETLLES